MSPEPLQWSGVDAWVRSQVREFVRVGLAPAGAWWFRSGRVTDSLELPLGQLAHHWWMACAVGDVMSAVHADHFLLVLPYVVDARCVGLRHHRWDRTGGWSHRTTVCVDVERVATSALDDEDPWVAALSDVTRR